MPLHLLGKKSWNVYNISNIEKVKRDEEAAAAREAAEEQCLQEVDAERRIQILRGAQVLHIAATTDGAHTASGPMYLERPTGKERKRRRKEGETDTERDIRYVVENYATRRPDGDNQVRRKSRSDAPLIDRGGHINLFPAELTSRNVPKNAEAEAEKAKENKEHEDQYTMRLSNAAGFKQAIGQVPWYYSTRVEKQEVKPIRKDIWSNEDPRRKERMRVRATVDDPLAIMRKGVKGLREVETQRKKWKEERQKEFEDLPEAEGNRCKKKEARLETDIEGFSLDKKQEIDDSNLPNRRHRHERSTHQHQHRSMGRRRCDTELHAIQGVFER